MGLASCLCGVLSGCELSRPEGAYNPMYPDAAPLDDFPDAGDDQQGTVDNTPDTFKDASVTEMPKDDSHAGLLGFYLARFDEPQTSSTYVGDPVGTLLVKSVTSRYFLILVNEDESGKLKSTEHMCGQTVASTCEQNCTASTSLFPSAAAKIPSSLPITRTLDLVKDKDTGPLNAPAASTYLGYDGTETDHALPTSLSDPRIWPGSGAGQEGLYTQLQLKVSAFGIDSGLTCQVNIVQQLRMNWTAYTAQQDGSFKLDGARGTFQTSFGSAGETTKTSILAAKADPSSKQSDCMGTGGSNPQTTFGANVVVFKKTDLKKCPKISDFDKLVPAELVPQAL
ncbi:MAG: hypothetical protein QM778_10455 [Myxococcales bacterium]